MNEGRKLSFEAFHDTLKELQNSRNVTERTFCDLWLSHIHQSNKLTIKGWYDPPPKGISVLFASDKDIQRINFSSLRKEKNWPKDIEINWSNGLLYAYSSFVNKSTGEPCDFAITLYFGNNIEIKNHFRNCFQVTKRVTEQIKDITSSIELFKRAEFQFKDSKLKNSVISITDSTPLDLGHSLPILNHKQLNSSDELSIENIELIRNSRKFINGKTSWNLKEVKQYTIEPQLKSILNPNLPQVSFHYIIHNHDNGEITLQNEQNELLKNYNLI